MTTVGLFGIGSNANAAAMATANPAAAQTLGMQGTLAFPGQQAMPGGLMGQPGSGKSIITKMLAGGAAGAGLGAGYGLLAGMVSFLPHVTIPMGALIGGAAGAALGLAKGLLDRRKASLALRAQPQAIPVGAGMQPLAVPKPLVGKVHSEGSSGPTVRWTQKALKHLRIYNGKVSGKLDPATAAAIRRYEVLKGVMPTGQSGPDLRQALAQDMKLARQFV